MPPTGEKTGDFPPVFIQFCVPPARHKKNATGLCYPWRCPGRWPVCIQLYGHGAEAPIDGCCTRILAFRGLSACQGSLNSSKIVVNEVVLTCLKCPWIQCFQGIIRFRLDFYFQNFTPTNPLHRSIALILGYPCGLHTSGVFFFLCLVIAGLELLHFHTVHNEVVVYQKSNSKTFRCFSGREQSALYIVSL